MKVVSTNRFPEMKKCLEAFARTKSALFIQYLGDDYFMPDTFYISKNRNSLAITNTGCVCIYNATFDDFYRLRNLIKNNWTDDIWSNIEDELEKSKK